MAAVMAAAGSLARLSVRPIDTASFKSASRSDSISLAASFRLPIRCLKGSCQEPIARSQLESRSSKASAASKPSTFLAAEASQRAVLPQVAAAEAESSNFFLSVLALSLGTSVLITFAGAGPAEAADAAAATVATAGGSGADLHSSLLSAASLDLHSSLGSSATLGFIPTGPLMSEFWDNVGRFVIYFFTVFTGGLYTLVKPIVDLLKKPTTAILVVLVLGGGFYVTYLTLSAMLGLDSSDVPLDGY
ncbi:hypothetical protein CLOM_g20400 [Closterium sp. NIES-68]|nr:hypothetical protein CLOM_g20400 [Closterium sp. NIES-68]GJP81692.1 hypothetical protein CLOP_g11833 [Closterium sp. NIES-67]